MSSFRVSATQVNFTAVDTINDDGSNGLEEWTVGILVDNATDWGALFSLRSWNVTVRPIPGGNNVYVDIGGGAGEGVLSIDNLDPHTAILTRLGGATELEPGTLRRKTTATFLITGNP